MRIPEGIRWRPTGRTLGKGGQGTVEEVRDSRGGTDARYALKALAKGRPEKAYQRFEREVKALQSLNHQYIAKVVDFSLDPDFPYYVMEFVEGAVPLKRTIEDGTNPFWEKPIEALAFYRKLLEVIDCCEDARLVHRDLSPANVLLIPDGSIRVIDFGLCQSEGDKTVTLVDEGVGTQNYMAPECESGAGAEISTTADLYSAGKLLWSAVTGWFAFAREAPAFSTKSMVSVFPKAVATWHLQIVFSKTIRKRPADRWQTAKDALGGCARVEYVMRSGYPPLHLLSDGFCPLCGLGELRTFESSFLVFGNPGLKGIEKLQCTICGFCFPVNAARLQQSVKEIGPVE